MLVDHLITSVSQDITEMKEPLTFFKRPTDSLDQPTIARSLSDGGMEQIIRLQVLGLALLIKNGEACLAEFIKAAQVRGTHMSCRQLGHGWLDDQPKVEEILHISQSNRRNLIAMPWHTAHQPLLHQTGERLAHRRFPDPRLTDELGLGNTLARL